MAMEEYIKIFIDNDYPTFFNPYLQTKTMQRLKGVGQFCGCDYTKLYSPLFFYSRFGHSLIVALMTYHFTHNKKEAIASLLHDTGTPCFAHSIDYFYGDSQNQETAEKDIRYFIEQDKELKNLLQNDNITVEDLQNKSAFPILENKSPKLCTDRLDGVFNACFIWLHTHSLKEIKEVYDDLVVLQNENHQKEIGFSSVEIGEKFIQMVFVYAMELQKNKDKYIMHYISEMIRLAVNKNLLTIEDLYQKSEKDIAAVLKENFSSWSIFENTKEVICTEQKPNNFYVSLEAKKRNVIPLVKYHNEVIRINEVSKVAQELYQKYNEFHDSTYAYVRKIKKL